MNRLLNIGFQGEHGAYSEMAVFQLFDRRIATAVPMFSFRDVFEAVEAGRLDFGIVPIENALAGAIDDNFDLLLEFDHLHIVAETQVRIEHNLIGRPGTPLSAIKKVLSHPQGLAQSRKFLEAHPEWETVPFYDTAGSVAHVAKTGDASLAAIASAEAARVYGMEILVAGVESNHQNFTRFFQLAPRSVPQPAEPNKASIVFATADEPGALSKCLAVFASHSVNMKKLESRPIQGRPWDYMFYVDVALPAEAAQFDAAFAELNLVAQDLRLLGKYRA
ncbi:MAG: prephenate dehydratase [Spirochaetales bacterium]